MKNILFFFSIPVAFLFLAIDTEVGVLKQNEAPVSNPAVVIQLFTSQGCSSCPPADKLLDEVKQTNKNVYVLSYHVDYWNRLGWKDPYSKKEYTNLQYQYGDKFNSRSVYTPQAVINGNEHFVGSNRTEMKSKLNTYLDKSAKNIIKVTDVKREGRGIRFNYGIQGEVDEKNIKFALVLNRKTTYVKTGENRQRSLTNTNIVIQEINIPISENPTGKGQVIIPESIDIESQMHIIAFIQDKNLVIDGATRFDI